ncbi:hypothetical protein E2R65_12465 [Mucilaginibacter phyllosphaerae]|uniref:Uncharacterized protein n=1 Tax=Mucilaginibacter phyllosphaerae TaxID=1812349 RepID=A0A4Y8ADC6_9SPHI|nr:hypothetical protein E2R65_12465 [Mucilaginibacter phyllosphaerae]
MGDCPLFHNVVRYANHNYGKHPVNMLPIPTCRHPDSNNNGVVCCNKLPLPANNNNHRYRQIHHYRTPLPAVAGARVHTPCGQVH